MASLLVLLSPVLLLVVVGGVVAVVALFKADTKDVPEVAQVWCSLFRRLADRVPTVGAAPAARPSPGEEAGSSTNGHDGADELAGSSETSQIGEVAPNE